MLPASPVLGFLRDCYFPVAVERKNSIDELVESIKDRTRFENELIRGRELQFFAVLVEDGSGYRKVVNGEYRSQYAAKALLASLSALSVRYRVPIVYIDSALAAQWISSHLIYFVIEQLKRGIVC